MRERPDNVAEFLEEIRELGQEQFDTATHIVEWVHGMGMEDKFGSPTPSQHNNYVPRLSDFDEKRYPFQVWADGHINVPVRYLKTWSPFDQQAMEQELRRRLASLPGIEMRPGFPKLTLSRLAQGDGVGKFLEEMEWIIEKLRAAHGSLTTITFRNEARVHDALELAGETDQGLGASIPAKDLPADEDALGVPCPPIELPPPSDQRDPQQVDPDAVDRGNRGHQMTLKLLRDAVLEHKCSPRAAKGEPQFDLAWRYRRRMMVAEVKSLTPANQEKQLRLGLGQVLRYRQQVGGRFPDSEVVPVLAVEGKPSDGSWMALCESLGVRLTWPDTMSSLFAP